MAQMKTLTVNGNTYTVTDPNAARIDDTQVGQQTWSSKHIVDRLCPSFSEHGSVVTCTPVEGYPLTITAEDGATKITRCGKNLLKLEGRTPVTSGAFDAASKRALDGNKLFIGVSPNNYFNNAVITEHALTETGVDFISTFVSYGIGFDMPVFPGEVYTASIKENGQIQLSFYKEDGSFISNTQTAVKKATAAAPAEAAWCMVSVTADKKNQPVSASNLQVNLGNAGLEYEAYRGEVFPAGEPVPALKGVNTLYADTGSITVGGGADPVVIINQLTDAIIAMYKEE